MMKRVFCIVCTLAGMTLAMAQGWTDEELAAANTAKDVPQLSTEEREVIKYLNLARLFPHKFAEVEVADYYGGEAGGHPSMFSDNRLSLLAELYGSEPCGALVYEPKLQTSARCLAAEQERNGEMGHTRHSCAKEHDGECCSYGFANGREIVLQLLIDDGVPDLGHRMICLDPGFGSVAVAIGGHPSATNMAVLDFAWGDYDAHAGLRYDAIDEVDSALRGQLYELMTRGVDADLKRERPSGTRVVNVQTAVKRSSGPDGVVVEKTETRFHEDGTRQVIVTTTTMNLDGVGNSTRQVRVER